MHALDLTDDESVTAFAKAVAADLGDIEVVVSNAGAVAPGTIHEVDPSGSPASSTSTSSARTGWCARSCPAMVERRHGDFVFVSSDVAVRARPFMSSYAAGKWGLEGMADALQIELEGTGVRASIVRPGPTWSEMGLTGTPTRPAFVLERGWVRAGPAPALPQTRCHGGRDRTW